MHVCMDEMNEWTVAEVEHSRKSWQTFASKTARDAMLKIIHSQRLSSSRVGIDGKRSVSKRACREVLDL